MVGLNYNFRLIGISIFIINILTTVTKVVITIIISINMLFILFKTTIIMIIIITLYQYYRFWSRSTACPLTLTIQPLLEDACRDLIG